MTAHIAKAAMYAPREVREALFMAPGWSGGGGGMLLEILIVGALGVVIFLLWRIFDVLVRTAKNQSDQATLVMQELELIRAGAFAMARVKEEEGWPEFDKLSHYVVREYIRPGRIASVLRAEGKTQEQINRYIAAARRLDEEEDG